MPLRLQFLRRRDAILNWMLRFVALCLCAFTLSAQSWDRVRALDASARVKVREISGPQHKGNIASVTPEAISIATPQGTVSVEKAKVARVEVYGKNRRLRNIAIGAGIGLGIAIAIDQTLGVALRNEGSGGGAGRAVTYIAPIGLFSAIGAAISPYKTIYRAP
jgi:hypothetical protein